MIFLVIYTFDYIYLKILDLTIYTFQNTIYTSSFLLKIPSKIFPPAAGRYIYHRLYIPQNLNFHYIYFANIYVYTIYTDTLVVLRFWGLDFERFTGEIWRIRVPNVRHKLT